MRNRWAVLALLFAVRSTMGFQFQALAAVGPGLLAAYGRGPADLGFVFGLYLLPGFFLALPGGALAARIGERRTVTLALALMLAGAVIIAAAPSWGWLGAGRLLAGVGGVVLNVVMSKMVSDWFTGREISTAMAVFVNSWPFGIALALVALPPVAAGAGIAAAFWATAAVVGAGLLAFALLCPGAPRDARAADPHAPLLPAAAGLDGMTLRAVLAAGLVWGLYNAGLNMVFGFAPLVLAEEGLGAEAAGWVASLVLWLMVLSIPAGGALADASRRRDTVLLAGLALFAVFLLVAARTGGAWGVYALLGIAAGLPAGPAMSLPAGVLTAATRAIGIGAFFTIYYVCVVAGPWGAGLAAEAAGTARIAYDLGAVMLAGAAGFLALHRIAARRLARGAA